ncbi:MAG TPA: hypothetical protein VEJ89_02620 [Myxococcaceae bacterium]|jgi:hypothetical protein|nr:hypothetical protein [Myxococcaceae bacterium]
MSPGSKGVLDSSLDRWVRGVTAAAMLALAAALLAVGVAYYARGGHPSPAPTTEVQR